MSKPSEIDYLDPFIEGTITAAARFRRVLIVLITASVLAFGAFWNSREGSWLNSRVATASMAKEYLALEAKLTTINNKLLQIDEELKNPEKTEDERKKLGDQKQLLEKDKQEAENGKFDRADAKKWYDIKKFNEGELNDFAEELEKARLQSVLLIHIPFFGTTFDVNDLGLLGGFTFVVILMWFRFSLWREYYNLSATFKEAKTKEHLEFCYKSLAMGQVLTVPPELDQSQSPQKPWGKIVRLLYFLPVAVQLTILVYDFISINNGWLVSHFNTIFGIAMSVLFWILSLLLTIWCLQLSRKIDHTWEDAAVSIQKKDQKPFSSRD